MFLSIVHPDDREAVNNAYISSLKDPSNTYEIEHRIVTRDTNEVRYVYEKGYHERNGNGRVVHSVGMVQDITERKIREQKLVISDRIFNYALDMLCVAGFDGYFKTLNPSWSKVLGYTTEELLSKPWLEYVHPDDKEATKNIKASIVDGQEVYQFENRYICKDGTVKWLSWNSFPYPDENIMYGVARDITYKKQTENKLVESELKLKEKNEEYLAINEELQQSNEELYSLAEDLRQSNQRNSAILSAIPDIMFVYSRNGVFLDYYQSNSNELLVKPEDFLNKNAKDVLPDYLAEINIKAIDALFETGEPQTYSYSLEIDGEVNYFDARMVMHGNDKALAIVRNITEQKKSELTIARNEQYLRTIIQTTTDGFWVVDKERKHVDVNDAYLAMSGYSREEFLDLTISDIDAEENLEATRARIERIIKNSSEIFETKHRRKDGSIFDVEISATFINRDGGQLVCFCRDITERKQVEQELQKSHKSISFLADSAINFMQSVTLADFYQLMGNGLQTLNPNAYIVINSVHQNEGYVQTQAVVGKHQVVGKVANLFGFKLVGKKYPFNESILELSSGKVVRFEGGISELTFGQVPKSIGASAEKMFSINKIYGIAILSNDSIIANVALVFTHIDDIQNVDIIEAFVRQASIAYNRIVAEESLRISEERFQLSMEATNDGLWDWDVKAKMNYYSPAYYTMLGYQVGGFSTSSSEWKDLVHPDDLKWVKEEHAKCVNGIADSFDIEFRMKSFTGEWKWIYSRGKVVKRDSKGIALRLVGTHIDITERKQFEETLQQRNTFIQTVLDNLPIGVALNNINEGQATYINKKFQEIYGWSEEALKNIPQFFERIYPDKHYREELMGRIMADIQSGDPERMRWENIKVTQENGSVRIINAVNIPLFEQNTMVSTVIDVTEQKEFEQALKESETRFKALHNASFGGITIHDKGLILDCNQGLSQITGYSQEELIGMDGLLLIAEETREMVREKIRAGYEKAYEAVGIRKDGSKYPLRLEARNIPYKGKQVRVVEFRDITEEKRLQDELKESELTFRALFEKGPIGVAYHKMIYDEKGIPLDYYFIDANESYKELTGVNPKGKLVTEAFPGIENDPSDWIGTFGQVAKTGKEIRFQQYLQPNDRWYDCVAYQYKPDHFVAAFLEVTDAKKAEMALQKSQEILSETQELTRVGGWEWDVEKQIMTWTDEVYRIHGLRREDIQDYGEGTIAKSIECYAPENRSKINELFRRCVEHGEPYDFEVPFTNVQGQKLWIRTTAKANYANGKIVSVIGNIMDITVRKQAELALQQSEERFKMLFEKAPVGYQSLTEDGCFLEVNETWLSMLGYTKEEVIGKWFGDFLTPEYTEGFRERFPIFKAEGKIHSEFKMVRKDGTEIFIAFDGRIGYTLNGEFQQTHCTLNDITEQRKAEFALRESEEKYRMLFEANKDGIAIFRVLPDESPSTFIEANTSAAQMLGYTYDEFVKLSVLDLEVEMDNSLIERRVKDIKTKGMAEFETKLRHKDGRLIYANVRGIAINYLGGPAVLNITRDITERKKAEQALHESEEMMRSSQSVAQICSYSTNLNEDEIGKSAWVCSPEFYKIFGIDETYPHTIEGWARFIHPDYRDEVFDYHESVVKEKKSFNREYKIIRINDGAERWVLGTGELEYDEQGKPVRMYGAIQDITERKQAEEALRESEESFRMLAELAPVGIIITDEEQNPAYASPMFTKIFGYTINDIPTVADWFVLAYPNEEFRNEVKQEWLRFIEDVKNEGKVDKPLEFPVHCKNGIVKQIEFRLAVSGNIDVIVFTDISDRKLAEQALRESEERFRGLYENATVGIYRTTPDGQILLANPALIKMLEYSSFEELTRRNLNNQGYETGYQRTQFMLQIEERGEVKGLQSAWRTKSGKVINISESARAVYDNKGNVLYYEGIVEDITERTKAVDALRASEERISSIFRVAPIGIGVVVNRVLTEVNQTICDITGYAKDELLGQSAQLLYSTRKEFEYVGNEKYRQIAEKGTGSVETAWQRKDGAIIDVLLSSTPISHDDLSQGVTFTALDITQRKQTERLMKGRLKLLEFADTHSLPELLKETLAVAEDLTGSQIGFYHFIDEENGEIKLNQWSHRTENEFCKVKGKFAMHYPIDKAGVWVECVKKRKPIIHNDYQALAHRKELPKGHALVSRELTVPVIRNRCIVAVLGIGNKATHYTKNDIDIITQLADMAWDIAERKMVQEALVASEEQYRNLFENMTQGFALHEMVYNSKGVPLDYRFVSINPAYEKLTGLLAKDIIGKTVLEVLPKTEPEWINTYAMVAETQESVRYENYSNELGRYYSVNAFSPHKGMFATIVSDVTQRKLAEMEVKKLSYGIEQSPVMVIITDTEGLIEYVNPKFSEITGYTSDEVLGKTPRILKSGRQSEHFYKLLWDTIKSGEIWKGEMLNRKKSGETYWESALISPMKDDAGNIRNFIAIKEDITERKKAEEALIQSKIDLKEKNEEYLALNEELTESNERIAKINKELIDVTEKAVESDKLKSAFLANMSHEIRTPMNAIIGFSEMLLNPNLPTDRKDFFAQILNTACHQLLNVVEDVIDISKIETGQMEVHRSETSINKAIHRIRDIFEPQAQSNGVEINTLCFFPDNRDNIVTDASKLNQVLTNLLNNALKFTESGTIEIGYALANKMLKFYVKDTGVGIDPSNHELIFERFRQVEMGSTRNYGGTGLGLPISKAFIEMLGGKIWVDSELGKGAKFFFTIPYEPVIKPEVSDGKKVEPDSFSFADKIILIAEDEEANYLYISELIEETKATLIRASDGQAAVDIIQSNPDIDLILMDIKMPVMTGVEATRIIRDMDIKVPIIALTAYAMTGDRENCLAAGCNEYISKPVRRTELFKAIAKYFTNS
jgi:PAS domain S-box-containing protein